MKKLSPKAKKVTLITGAVVICVGLLSTVLYQQASADSSSSNLPVSSVESASLVAPTSSAVISVAPITERDSVASSTAKTSSAFVPSKGKSDSAPLTSGVSKPKPPTKPTIQGDSKNGKQPTNKALTDKSKKPTYTAPQTPDHKNDSPSTKKSGGSYYDPVFGNKTGTGGQGTVVEGNWGDGEQVGIMD